MPTFALGIASLNPGYLLPRPGSGRKSTGLGLNFVQEVAELHGGELRIGNVEGGVEVCLSSLPGA